jgi:hypothetical protein
MRMFLRLWNEEIGAILSAEVMLVASILVVGVIAGLASLRDSIVTELADVAQALANVNQSFSFSGVKGHHASGGGGGSFHDDIDFCDRPWAMNDHGNSKCVRICTSGNSGECDDQGGHGGKHY